jgi:hypothetical protein
MKSRWQWLVGITVFLGIAFLFVSHDPLLITTALIFLMLVAAFAVDICNGSEYESVLKNILHCEVIVLVAMGMFGYWSFPYASPIGHVLAVIFALEIGITIYAWLLNRVIKIRYSQTP